MRLYGELFKKITADSDSGSTEAEELFAPARCLLVFGGNGGNNRNNKNNQNNKNGNDGGYFEGVKGVREYTPERIVLDFKKRALEIEGMRLTVAKYCDGDLELKGTITSLRIIGADQSSVSLPKKSPTDLPTDFPAKSRTEPSTESPEPPESPQKPRKEGGGERGV